MRSRKNWIAFTLVSLRVVFAQQNPKTRVTVEVTDVTGANVPRAIVDVTSSRTTQTLTFEADGNGKAEFELLPGDYDLHVKSQGFCPFRRFLEPLSAQNQIVTAKLQIDSCPGPCAGPCVTVLSESGVQIYPEPRAQAMKASKEPLKVIVTDSGGAVVQPAFVEVISTLPCDFGHPWAASTSTNTLGEASLDLPKGEYDLTVAARGFKKWSTRIETGEQLNQTIRAKLVPANYSGRADCMSCVSLDDLKISPVTPTLAMIPINSLLTLHDLPAHRARRVTPSTVLSH